MKAGGASISAMHQTGVLVGLPMPLLNQRSINIRSTSSLDLQCARVLLTDSARQRWVRTSLAPMSRLPTRRGLRASSLLCSIAGRVGKTEA
mmetsp:Transcript_49474/g.129245  ORF Transcript_49474/g.129245 Transcript_49474/m.129245 type:complete len:91 (+) Transcript_49474:249-521(+)